MEETIVTISLPKKLSENDFEVKRILIDEELGIKITQLNIVEGLSIEYSINEDNYSTSNIFKNISQGDHTIRVRDNYNCVLSLSFSATMPTSDERFKPLKELNWTGEYDKTSPTSDSFDASVFSSILNQYLKGTIETRKETKTIKGTRKSKDEFSLCFPFAVKDDSQEELESEKQEFCIDVDCISE